MEEPVSGALSGTSCGPAHPGVGGRRDVLTRAFICPKSSRRGLCSPFLQCSEFPRATNRARSNQLSWSGNGPGETAVCPVTSGQVPLAWQVMGGGGEEKMGCRWLNGEDTFSPREFPRNVFHPLAGPGGPGRTESALTLFCGLWLGKSI